MRIMLERIGAFGDNIIVTPLVHYLKEQGNEIYLLTSEIWGEAVFSNNPYIDKTILYKKDSVPLGEFLNYCKELQKEYKCDKLINMAESLEVSLLTYPTSPLYMFPKYDRVARCDKNVYEYAFTHAGYDGAKSDYKAQLFFTQEEKSALKYKFPFLGKSSFTSQYILLWGLTGSGRNKAYPPAEDIQMQLIKKYDDLIIVTVGDEACRLLENLNHPRIIHLSGMTSVREVMLMTRYVNLVVCPDTGLLHSAGCYSTPKIGILGHCTKNHITKHFENDYSLEANCACAPCYRLITQADIQCPIEPITRATWCMRYGFNVEEVFRHICFVLEKDYYGNRKTDSDRDIIVPAGYEGSRKALIVA